MEPHTAVEIVLQGINIGTKNGAYGIKDAGILAQAIARLQSLHPTPSETEPPTTKSKEEIVLEEVNNAED